MQPRRHRLTEKPDRLDRFARRRLEPRTDPRQGAVKSEPPRCVGRADLGPAPDLLDQPARRRVAAEKMKITIGDTAAARSTPEQIGTGRVDASEMTQVEDDLVGLDTGFNLADRVIDTADRINRPVAMRLNDRLARVFAQNDRSTGLRTRWISPHIWHPSRYRRSEGVQKCGEAVMQQPDRRRQAIS